jgi:hypothetical protein
MKALSGDRQPDLQRDEVELSGTSVIRSRPGDARSHMPTLYMKFQVDPELIVLQ